MRTSLMFFNLLISKLNIIKSRELKPDPHFSWLIADDSIGLKFELGNSMFEFRWNFKCFFKCFIAWSSCFDKFSISVALFFRKKIRLKFSIENFKVFTSFRCSATQSFSYICLKLFNLERIFHCQLTKIVSFGSRLPKSDKGAVLRIHCESCTTWYVGYMVESTV